MPRERTFIMIKPDGVQRGLVAKIMERFEQKGFKLVGLKFMQASEDLLKEHYADLSSKPFFAVWEGDGVVKAGRTLLGATKPSESAPGSIRGDFCIDVGRNICSYLSSRTGLRWSTRLLGHGSDSVESANKEIALWFKPEEVVDWKSHSESWIYEK
eukprot:746531-Hanusia_phi.AAC.2